MTSPASSVRVRGDSRGRRGRRPWGHRGEASALAGAGGSDPARGGRTPSLRGESVFPGASPAKGGTRVSLSSCGVRSCLPGPPPPHSGRSLSSGSRPCQGTEGSTGEGRGGQAVLCRGTGEGVGPVPAPSLRPDRVWEGRKRLGGRGRIATL